MDNIKEVAKIITRMSYTDEEREAFAYLAKIANEPEPERKAGLVKDISDALDYLKENADLTPGRLKEVIANIEAKNGKLTREEAMIAYCSGKRIRVLSDGCDYNAWLIGQTPFVQFDNKKPSIGAIPLFVDNDYRFEIAPEPPNLVDGLTACKAYRYGQKVKHSGVTWKYVASVGSQPDFVLDGWEIID